MQNFFAMGIISVLWALVGFSLAFGDGGGFIGDLSMVGLKGLGSASAVAARLRRRLRVWSCR